MEELVGEFWHRLITRQTNTDHKEAQVSLADLGTQLAPFYRALGGAPGKVIEGAAAREFKLHRRILQRVAGTHRRTNVAWQDDRSVRLPPTHALFSDKALNEALYFWLAALAAQLPRIHHWFTDNQRITLQLLKTRPGLAKTYYLLVDALLPLRPELDTLDGDKLERELAIRQALKEPGSVAFLPKAAGDPYPIFVWLYPEPIHSLSIAPDDEIDETYIEHQDQEPPDDQAKGPRKEAKRTNDSKETDGLLVFMLESLFSWTEQVELDRPQEEDVDMDVSAAAEDLDILTLSRQRRAQSAKLKFDMDLPSAQNDDLAVGPGLRLPEWDYKRGAMINDYCFIQPMLADDALPAPIPERLKQAAHQLKKRFSALNFQTSWLRRQTFGTELDLDACIDKITEPNLQLENQDFYKARSQNQRDLSCLLLADLSMSTDSALNSHQRVIDVIRDSILLFAEALSGSGDPFAIYGFSSIKNKQIRYHVLKNFAEPYSDATRGRILAVKPGFYTRMGAGIRQSIEVLKLQPAHKRLLLILSDGKPNDIDHYEGRYGIEDTRKAVIEAKRQGIQAFCITIDEDGNEYLPYLFGDKGYAVVSDLARLPKLLPKLYLNLTGQS